MEKQDEQYLCRMEVMKKDIRKQTIERMIFLRKSLNLTQADIAKRTGLKCPNISRFESGACNVTLDMLIRMAEAMDCEVNIQISPREGK